jgi:hypothetical protein
LWKSNSVSIKVQTLLKLNFSYLLVFSVVLTLLTLASAPEANAQENIPGYDLLDPMHPGINYEDKTLLSEPLKTGRDSTFAPTVRATSAPAKKSTEPLKSSSGRVKEGEEDPLSFNFLYFIIQKFKTSDIIDQ